MIRNLTTNDVIVAGRQEMLRAAMVGRPSWHRTRSIPRALNPNDFCGRHPMLCLVLVAALLLFSSTF